MKMPADMNVFASLEPKAKIVKLVSLKSKFHVRIEFTNLCF